MINILYFLIILTIWQVFDEFSEKGSLEIFYSYCFNPSIYGKIRLLSLKRIPYEITKTKRNAGYFTC
ncbi:hypothetical protein B7709_05845 [Streptococcus oralis subsp. dentisani]|uniref:Uncharacterized protein n=1 Tax=Streptococcus oralis subsp. dentisani TaxID=1458253 RepID=A0A1X1IXT1_STROR|nr:hypothetical protein B7709_05845 [Streptococcus oralis subsp. dentisani]